MIASDLKEKVTPISSPFLFLPIASRHSALPLTKVSASEVPAILKKFILKETTLGTAILKVYLEVRLCLCGVVLSDLNLWQGEKPTADLVSFFFERLSTSLSSLLSYLKLVWLQIIWLKSSHNPQWKQFGQNLLDGMVSRKPGLTAEYCSIWQQWCQRWASLEMNFTRKTCTLEAETLGSD